MHSKSHRSSFIQSRRDLLTGIAMTTAFALPTGASAQRDRRGSSEASIPTSPVAAVEEDSDNRVLGTKRIAFIPIIRPRLDVPPQDWKAQIQRRAFSDIDSTGNDVSLRAYFRAASYGRADIDGEVLDPVSLDQIDVPVNALFDRTPELRARGFDAAALVMVSGGAGTAEYWPTAFWARFSMQEQVGVWAMELLHVLAHFVDLYIYLDGADWWFDNMASASGTHPSAFTKLSFGWLDQEAIGQLAGRFSLYDVQTLAERQNRQGQVRAVRIGASDPHLMVEARQKVDQFDGRIPNGEGVVVYQVESSDLDPNPGVVHARLALKTRTPLAPGQSYTAENGVRINVLEAINRGYSVSVEDPNIHVLDRSSRRDAVGAPSAVAVSGVGEFIAYRHPAGGLIELSRDIRGASDGIYLTAWADIPRPGGDPFCYVAGNQHITLFRDRQGYIHGLYPTPGGGVGHDALSSVAQAPRAAGDPSAYYHRELDMHHIVYRGTDNHLHEMYATSTTPVAYGGNLTGTIGAPRTAGQPVGMINGDGTNIVVYRAVNAHIMSVYWKEGPSGLDDLSGVAGSPAAAGDPFGYYTPHDDVVQVAYLGNDGHIWELYSQGAAAVVGWDLTGHAGGPRCIGRPSAYYDAGTHTKHVVYRSAGGRLNELWWTPGGGIPQHIDITERYGAPLAADRPIAYSTQGPTTQHVVYRANDNRIYEVLW
jgi:hypothetical protein